MFKMKAKLRGRKVKLSGRSEPVKRPRHKMDDPERFDGTDLSLYPQFEGLLFAKLEIGNEKEKV